MGNGKWEMGNGKWEMNIIVIEGYCSSQKDSVDEVSVLLIGCQILPRIHHDVEHLGHTLLYIFTSTSSLNQ